MNPITYAVGDVTFQLKESIDLSWLTEMGHVFAVFDEQDSGNICFGVEREGEKKFVKFGGAKPLDFNGSPEDAVSKLMKAIPLYYELKHPSLIEIIDHFKVESGYAAVFKWFDGDNFHPHWIYPPPAKYTDPNSPFYKFKKLPIEQRLDVLDSIFKFHVFVEEKNYVAIDFYDGSILFDFKNNVTKICDIDFYEKRPFINNMGRLWGSSRFMSPEEFELGSEIDSYTNVYTMGATAFVLIGGELDRSFSKWDASKELYDIACCAVNDNKQKRFQTVNEFYIAWNNAKGG